MAIEKDTDEILDFLHLHIDSIELLQVLQLLQQSPNKSWSTGEIAQELRSSESSIAIRLKDLYNRKVLVPFQETNDRHRYGPSSQEMGQIVEQLIDIYKTRPFWVIEAIYSPNTRKVESPVDLNKDSAKVKKANRPPLT